MRPSAALSALESEVMQRARRKPHEPVTWAELSQIVTAARRDTEAHEYDEYMGEDQ